MPITPTGIRSAKRYPMRGILWLALAACCAAGAGCSKSQETPKPEEHAHAAPTGEIPKGAMIVKDITPGRKGGRLIMGNPGDPKTFNPPLSEDNVSNRVNSYLFEALYGYNLATQKDEPSLAESWDYNKDTMEWTFHLRPGLKWSDGQPLTSDDALFYTELILDPDVPTSEGEGMKINGKVFTFSAPDPLTFVAKIPEVDSFAILSLGLIKPLPRHKYGQAHKDKKFAQILGTNTPPKDLVCSGPFKLKEFKSGEKVVLEANPYYYRYDEKGTQLPYLDEVVMLNVEDYEALALRFQAGDLDLVEDIQPTSLVAIEDGQKKGDYTLFNPGLRLGSTNFWFNLKPGGTYEEGGKRVAWPPPTLDPPPPADAAPPPDILAKSFRYFVDPVKQRWFNNAGFRQACSMATNRDAIVKTILFGQGAPVYGMEGEANKQWNNPDIAKFPFDLKKAAEALDKLGYTDRDGDGIREDDKGNPIRFSIITNKENNVREKVGVLLKEDMRRIGFDVTLQLLDFNNIVTRTGDTFDYEACLLGLGSGTPPHPAMGKNVWRSSGRMHQWNPGQKSPATPWEAQTDELYERLRKTFDYPEQKKIYGQMQAIWAEQQPMITLMTLKVYVAASNKIGNLKPTVLDPHLTHNLPELYIKEK